MKKNIRIIVLLAPAILFILLLFFGGFLLGILQSFSYFPLIGMDSPDVSAYEEVLNDGVLIKSLVLTIWVSSSATLLTLVLAVTTALAFRSAFTGRRVLLFVFQFPLTVPHIIIALGASLFLSQSGTLARLLFLLGGITDPSGFPVLINDRLGLGIIFVYLWKQIPFIAVIVLSVLQSLGNDYEELARSLGAGRFQVLLHVILPLIKPALIPGGIICFAYTFGSYEVPYLLGRPYPTMLSVLVYRYFSNPDLAKRPEAMALSVLMTAFLLFLVVIYKRFLSKGDVS